jgi:hypothetical protein
VMNGLQAAIEKSALDDHIGEVYEGWGLSRDLFRDLSSD